MKRQSISRAIALGSLILAATLMAGCGSSTTGSSSSSSTTSTTTTLTSSSASTTTGTSITLTATVSPSAATGTVTFYSGSTSLGSATLSSGTATLTTSFSTAGTYSITAEYGGSSTYASSTSSALSIAVSTSLTSTTTTLTSTSYSLTAGISFTLTATVSPSAATGSVEFYDTTTSTVLQTVSLSSGTATLTTSLSAVETHVIDAIYEGSSTYATSTSSTISIVVGSSSSTTSTTTTLTSTSYAVTAGTSFTLTATVSPSAATGSVEFYDTTTSTDLESVTLSSGTATLTTSLSAVETHVIEAIYSGDSNYTTSTSSTISIVVSSSSSGTSTTTSLSTASSTAYPGSLVALTATITASGNAVTSTSGTVTFSYTTSSDTTATTLTCSNTSSTTASVGSSGTAVCPTHFSSTSSYTITATFSGDSTYASSTSSSVNETVESGSYSLNLSSYTSSTGSTTAENGDTVKYTAYTNVVYAVNPVDKTYETMNIYIPTSVAGSSVSGKPILFDIGVGGYMSSTAGQLSSSSGGTSNDAYALNEGYVIVSPGCRGRDNGSSGDYYGVAPAAMVDLKAAVRFLRYNYNLGAFTGDVSHIVDDGGSAGGALAALLGASGNSSLYYSYLAAIGAADADDNIFAVGAQSPITNLDHADGAYEMQYGYNTLGSVNETISDDLIDVFDTYQDDLALADKHGSLGTLTHSNITEFILDNYLEPSLERYLKNGGSAPSFATCSTSSSSTYGYTCTFTFSAYVSGVFGSRGAVKEMPAFDSFFDLSSSSPDYSTIETNTTDLNTTCPAEVLEFGNPTGTASTVSGCTSGSPRHFTNFSSEAMDGTDISSSMQTIVNMMNPMYFLMNDIANSDTTDPAQYWYIRDGTKAPDTSAYVIIDLATAAENLLGTSHVNAWEDWGEGHNVETDSSGNQTGSTFMTWVFNSVAAD
ncbi:MAG: Ig-like domain repeat protein [Terracidiphilus sp.]